MSDVPYPGFSVMLVDDEVQFLRTARIALAGAGVTNVEIVSDSREVAGKLKSGTHGVVVLDITMPHVTGTELLSHISSEHPGITVIMITGINDVETAVTCMRQRAFDYIVKPVNQERLVTCITRAIERRIAATETEALRNQVLEGTLKHPEAFEHIVTGNRKMLNIFEYAEAIGQTKLPLLITGETGTGKELMARALHSLRDRASPFVAVNVSGLDDTMFSDTLFGHVKGAFTGADAPRKGLIEEAQDGTLFLDEIGDLKEDSQIKLLRLIQEGEYFAVGSDSPKRSRARLVVATNREIGDTASFRKDLFYRLEAHRIHLPALRERREDIGLLARHFVAQAFEELSKKPVHVPSELEPLLVTYHFPGNVRELRGMVFDAVGAHKGGTLSLASFKTRIGDHRNSDVPEGETPQDSSSTPHDLFSGDLPTLKRAEEMLLAEALRRAGGNKTLAASMLGITRQTMNNRMKRQ